MIRTQRAKWTIRLSLLALMIFVVTVFAILLLAGKHRVGAATVKELLRQSMRSSEDLERAIGVFGPPDYVLTNTSGKQMAWIFEDSLLDTSPFVFVVQFDDQGDLKTVATMTNIHPLFSKYQWERLKRRLGFDWTPFPQ